MIINDNTHPLNPVRRFLEDSAVNAVVGVTRGVENLLRADKESSRHYIAKSETRKAKTIFAEGLHSAVIRELMF